MSFLHLWPRADDNRSTAPTRPIGFDFTQLQNHLLSRRPDATAEPLVVGLGRFAGRSEAIYPVRSVAASVFVFVLAGAFEVESRLLQEKDGLALRDVTKIEFEALSNDALLLVLELPAEGGLFCFLKRTLRAVPLSASTPALTSSPQANSAAAPGRSCT